MEAGKLIVEKKGLGGETILEMTTLNGEPIPPEETPKKRPYSLPVIPSVEPEGLPPNSYIVLAPPPLPMPYGLGVTCENGGDIDNAKGRVLEAWANEPNDDPVDLTGRPCNTFIRKNEYYAECSASGTMFNQILSLLYISSVLYPLAYLTTPATKPFFGSIGFYIIFIPQIFLLLLTLFCIFYEYENLPTTIFNRLRDEIYIYSSEKKALLIKKYSTATFLMYTYPSVVSTMEILIEQEKDLQDRENHWYIDSVRGLCHIVATWEYIRRYMAAGEGYKDLPSEDKILFFLPFMRLAERLDEKIFSRPHRWPPEIERLLWPENKNAPLPAGWQYDTWIPYDIPQGGFDNSELLRQRAEQLQAAAGQHTAQKVCLRQRLRPK